MEMFFPDEKENVLVNPLIFGSFKNALNDDYETRLYEDYGTYEVIYTIFENVTYIIMYRYIINLLLFK